MADLIKKIRTAKGDAQIDYNALANLPDYYTKEEVDTAISDAIQTALSGIATAEGGSY